MGSRLLYVVAREKTLNEVFTTFDRDFDVNIGTAALVRNF
jgi:hypothetical protein